MAELSLSCPEFSVLRSPAEAFKASKITKCSPLSVCRQWHFRTLSSASFQYLLQQKGMSTMMAFLTRTKQLFLFYHSHRCDVAVFSFYYYYYYFIFKIRKRRQKHEAETVLDNFSDQSIALQRCKLWKLSLKKGNVRQLESQTAQPGPLVVKWWQKGKKKKNKFFLALQRVNIPKCVTHCKMLK